MGVAPERPASDGRGPEPNRHLQHTTHTTDNFQRARHNIAQHSTVRGSGSTRPYLTQPGATDAWFDQKDTSHGAAAVRLACI